jgi:hypothetical protein
LTKDAIETLQRFTLPAGPKSRRGDFVAFLDEEDPDAGVGFFRAGTSHPYIWMPTEVYAALLERHSANSATRRPSARRARR